MGIIHYLNVLEGDCNIIQHSSGRISVIDVNNAFLEAEIDYQKERNKSLKEAARVRGNFNQKANPVNPISYLKKMNVTSIFRFILTHPDMDHMGGIKALFKEFSPLNFWDTDNNKEMTFDPLSPYNETDWVFYKKIRDSNPQDSPKRLVFYSGDVNQFFNKNSDGSSGGDGLYILAPTKELIASANETGDFNDASYVILYKALSGKILFAGDSHDKTWEYILCNNEADVTDIDVLIAPHHGRKTNRSYEFLDVLNPKLTLFGNALSEHLAYDAWNSRDLPYVTNNQANCMIIDANNTNTPPSLFVTNETYARSINQNTFYAKEYNAYFCYDIT